MAFNLRPHKECLSFISSPQSLGKKHSPNFVFLPQRVCGARDVSLWQVGGGEHRPRRAGLGNPLGRQEQPEPRGLVHGWLGEGGRRSATCQPSGRPPGARFPPEGAADTHGVPEPSGRKGPSQKPPTVVRGPPAGLTWAGAWGAPVGEALTQPSCNRLLMTASVHRFPSALGMAGATAFLLAPSPGATMPTAPQTTLEGGARSPPCPGSTSGMGSQPGERGGAEGHT